MTPEGKVKAQVRKILDAHKPSAYYCMPATGGYGRSGVPDFIGCIRGHFFAIECKAGKGVVTALQSRELVNIDKACGLTLVIREDNIHLVSELLNANL